MMTTEKTVLEEVSLLPGEKKTVLIPGSGIRRLGILVREVSRMRKADDAGDANAIVFLTQSVSGTRVGTYYSASVLFDLSLSREFSVENMSSIASDVAVYSSSSP